MQHWQTTLLVFASLMTMEFIAATAYCMDLTWIMYMRSCSRHNPVTVDRDVRSRHAAPPAAARGPADPGLAPARRASTFAWATAPR